VDAESGSGMYQVAVVSSQDLGNEAFLEMLDGFRKEDSFLDHFSANIFQAFLESKRRFDIALAYAAFLF
jgi:hypothetical protein